MATKRSGDARLIWLRVTPAQFRWLAAQRRTRPRIRDGKGMRETLGEVLRRMTDEAMASRPAALAASP